MSWRCFPCCICVISDYLPPVVCPECGKPVEVWEGACSSCSHSDDCAEKIKKEES
jgi:hypothetical protein